MFTRLAGHFNLFLAQRVHTRDRFLFTAGTAGMIQRIAATGLGFITTGIVTRMLGRETYGAWATLSAIPAWLILADVGIYQSLTTRLGHLFGCNDTQKSSILIWSAFWCQFALSITLTLALLLVWNFLPFERIFAGDIGISPTQLKSTCLWIVLGTLLTLPLRSYPGILMSRQRPVDNAFLNILTPTLVLIITYVGYKNSAGISTYAAISNLTFFFSYVIGLIWVFRFRFPELFHPFQIDWKSGLELSRSGFVFFLGGVTWSINSTADSLMLARLVGAGPVADYNLTFKLFTTTSLLTSVAGSGLVFAYAEARGRGDISWIESRYNFTIKMAAVAGLVSATMVGLIAPWAIDLWSGGHSQPSSAMVWNFAIWFTFFPIQQMIAFLMAGLNRPKDMFHVGIATALINIPISYLFIKTFGASGASAGSAIALLVGGIIYGHSKVRLILRELPSTPA